MRDGHDQDAAIFDSINNAKRKSAQQVSARSAVERWPCLRKANDRRFGRVYLVAECGSGCCAALCVPARCSFCLFQSFLEIFKLAGHGRLPRGCDDAPPTMGLSWRCPRRLDRAAPESLQTTPLQRQGLLPLRGFESVHRRARLALRQTAEELLPGAVWHPYLKISTSNVPRTIGNDTTPNSFLNSSASAFIDSLVISRPSPRASEASASSIIARISSRRRSRRSQSGQRFVIVNGFFFTRKPAALDRSLNESPLLGRRLDIHTAIVTLHR